MARIRILELPTMQVGELYKTPFALVIDQVASDHDDIRDAADNVVRDWNAPEITQEAADEFARAVGAEGAIVTSATLEVE